MNEFVSSYYGELYHHGIKGMKWGVRRYQHEDGSYTVAGKKRRNAESDNGDVKSQGTKPEDQAAKKAKVKKAVKIGAAVAGTAAVAYGAYKLSNVMKNKSAIQAGAKFVSNTNKAYASMNMSEARELRDKAAAFAEARGFKPTGDSNMDLLRMMQYLI